MSEAPKAMTNTITTSVTMLMIRKPFVTLKLKSSAVMPEKMNSATDRA